MHLSSDEIILWQWGWVNLNVTIITTWCIMLLMSAGGWLITRKLNQGLHIPRWQNALEVVVLALDSQIKEVGLNESQRYLPFIGTLFLFILISNILVSYLGMNPLPAQCPQRQHWLFLCFWQCHFLGYASRDSSTICALI